MALVEMSRRCAPALFAGLFLCLGSSAGFADERCAQLVALRNQYSGVTLTDEQKQIKVQLVAWYRANCGRATLHAAQR
jgi:hypothetical protein